MTSSIKYLRIIFFNPLMPPGIKGLKTNVFEPLRTRTYEYQGGKNVSFLDHFAYALNG